VHAHAGVDNGDHNQDDGDDGKEGHRGPGGQILRERGRCVHSVQLEAEVGHGREEKQDNDDHAEGGFPSDEPGRTDQDKDGHGDGDDGQIEFSIMIVQRNNDQELDGETEEEKEIKFQQSNVDLEKPSQRVNRMECWNKTYLISQISAFHTQIGTDVLVDCPGELVVQFPRHEGHQ